tara:strand:+ start:67 stop:675 length:609 start_codon:yes stop_codon:yes gene_type:complete
MSVKVVILGDTSIGKTSIIQSYISSENNTKTSTLGAVFFQLIHNFKCSNNNNINLSIQYWDTAGQERYHSLIPMYIRDADFTILSFDLTNYMTFLNLNKWIKLAKQNIKNTKFILIGCKSDIDKNNSPSKEEIDTFINEYIPNSKFFRTSSITGENIENIFLHIKKELEELGEMRYKLNSNRFNKIINLKEENKNLNKNCCF